MGYDANCMLALGSAPTDINPILSDTYYISPTAPQDPDFGDGVIYFGFLLCNEIEGDWYMYWDDRTGGVARENQFKSVVSDFDKHKNENAVRVSQNQFDPDVIRQLHEKGDFLKEQLALRNSE